MRTAGGSTRTCDAEFHELYARPADQLGLKLVDVQDGWTMLDVGCGGGFTIRRLLKRSQDAQVYGIDISEESVAKAKKVNADVLDKQVFVRQGSAECPTRTGSSTS